MGHCLARMARRGFKGILVSPYPNLFSWRINAHSTQWHLALPQDFCIMKISSRQHITAAVWLALFTSAGTSQSYANKALVNSKALQADITTKGLMSHLIAFGDIATQNGGNRAFGTPGYAASVDYIWKQVSSIPGAKAWKQDFSVLFDKVESIGLSIDGRSIPVSALRFSPSTSKEGLTAEVVAGPEGIAACNDTSYENLKVVGKIVIIQAVQCGGSTPLVIKYPWVSPLLPAARAGAAAVLFYSDMESDPSGKSLGDDSLNSGFTPVGFLYLADGLNIKKRLKAGQRLEGHFQHTQILEQKATQNVFVETEGGDAENVIVVGAHLDSVLMGPGINDNGSGSSLILELFLAIQKYRTTNKIRFAWWGDEENGDVGSNVYCKSLYHSNAVHSILAYLNFDMVARAPHGVGYGDGNFDGKPLESPPGSDTITRLFLKSFLEQNVTVDPSYKTSGSDFRPFWMDLFKPIGYLTTRVHDDPCYHSACDTIDNVDPEVITINTRVSNQLTILSGARFRVLT